MGSHKWEDLGSIFAEIYILDIFPVNGLIAYDLYSVLFPSTAYYM